MNELDAVPIGVPARRLAGVAGAEIDLRWRWAGSRLHSVGAPRGDAGHRQPPGRGGVPDRRVAAVSRLSPVLRPAGPSVVDRPAVKTRRSRRTPGATCACRRSSSSTATGPAVLGNADLVPEHGTNADLGALDRSRRRTVASRSRTTVFGARVDDLDPVAVRVAGAGARRNTGAGAHPGVEQELRLIVRALEPAGRAGDVPGRARSQRRRGHARQASCPYHAALSRLPSPGAGARRRCRRALELAPTRTRTCAWATTPTRQPGGPGARACCSAAACQRRVAARRLRMTASAANLTDTRLEDVDPWSLPGGRCSLRSRTRRSAAARAARPSSIPRTVSEPMVQTRSEYRCASFSVFGAWCCWRRPPSRGLRR